jgi:hypothetical protein
MALKSTPVSRCLDKRLKLLGLEIPDVLLVFITLSVLNFLFGQTNMKLLLVWCPPLILGFVLYFGKRGKPENYLIHWIRYQVLPGHFSAFEEPSIVSPPPRLPKRKSI